MSATKRKNPYQMLLEEIKDWCRKVKFRHEKVMWVYQKNRLNQGWPLRNLYERVKAAEQLGYDVILIANDEGLSVRYRKQVPNIPYSWQ